MSKFLDYAGVERLVSHLKKPATETSDGLMSKEDKAKLNEVSLYGEATTATSGLMSSSDKTKLDGIATGAEANQNAFANVKVGGVTVAADSKTDTLTLTAGDNVTLTPNASTDTITITATDTKYSEATSSSAGLMSAADKVKLASIESGAEANAVTGVKGSSESTYRTGAVNITKANIGLGNVENKSSATIRSELTSEDIESALGFTPSSEDSNTTYTLTQDADNGRKLNLNGSDGSKISVTVPDTQYSEATTSAAGLMSAADKSKLAGVSAGAEVNQNAFGNVKVGTTTLAADSKTDTLTITAGSNITLTPDASSDTFTIAATDTTYSEATTSKAGLMSASDKSKLDAIDGDDNTTYTIAKSGNTVTLTGSDGSTSSFTDANTTYNNATTSTAGLMSSSDKTKLDGIATGAEANQNAFANVKVGTTTVAADGKTDTLTIAAGTNVTVTPDASSDTITIAATDTKYSNATTSTAGLMSSGDKTKLDGIASGAEVNQSAFANVKVGTTTVAADSKTDTLELVAGSNVTLTPDATNDKVTIAATDTTYSAATQSDSGLMSAADKKKLDGIAEGATNSTDTNTTYTLTQDATDGHKITLTPSTGNATTITIPDNNTTYSNATTSAAGLMSSADKTKLDGVASGAEVNQNAFGNVKVDSTTLAADSKTDTLTITAGDNITLTPNASSDSFSIAATDTNTTYSIAKSGNTVTLTGSDGSKSTFTDANTTYSNATTSTAGLMSSGDKTKLDGVAAGAEVNQNAFASVKVGTTTVAANGKTDTLELAAGSNVTLTPDETNDKVTIAATDTNTTYSIAKSGSTITLTGSDGSTSSFTDANTTYSAATTSANGLMSSTDKTKLDGIASGAEVNQSAFSNVKVGTTTVAAGSKTDTLELVAGSNITLTPDATNDKVTIAATNTTYSDATTSAHGLMTAADKTKLNGVATGAEVNQNAFSNVVVGSTTVAADSKTDTLTFVAGSNITLTPDATNDKITIAATDTNTTYSNMGAATASAAGTAGLVPAPAAGKQTSFLRGDGTWAVPTNTTYSIATDSANGLMSSTDKSKLAGIATGAEVNQNAFSNVVVGSTTIAADGKTDTLTLAAGSNVTLTPDATNDKVTIAATNTTYTFTNKAATLAWNTTTTIATVGGTDITVKMPANPNTNTTYTASSPISLSGTTFSHANSGVTAATYGTNSATALTPGFGSTFSVPGFAVNATGHVTSASSHTVKIPSTTATTSAAGLMSTSDKTWVNAYATPDTSLVGGYVRIVKVGNLVWFMTPTSNIQSINADLSSESGAAMTIKSGYRPKYDVYAACTCTQGASTGWKLGCVRIRTNGQVSLFAYGTYGGGLVAVDSSNYSTYAGYQIAVSVCYVVA